MIHHWKALLFFFENPPKNCKFAKIDFFAKSSYKVKMFAKKNVQKTNTLLKAPDHAILNMQKIVNFKN